jgi:hypothetical protein
MGETTMTGWTMRGTAFAAALVVSGAGAAQAATLTVTDTGTLGTGFEVPLSVAAFDPSLGNLTAVAWSLVIDWSAEVTFGNPNAITVPIFPGTAQLIFQFFVVVEGAGLGGLAGFSSPTLEHLLEDGRVISPSIAPGGEATAFAPPRTVSFYGATEAPTGLGAGTLADWQARGAVGLTIVPAVSASAASPFLLNESGQSVQFPISSRIAEDLTATLSVTYTYDPVTGGGGGPDDPVDPVPVVPLPAGLPLLLGGLAVLAVVRRRRGA